MMNQKVKALFADYMMLADAAQSSNEILVGELKAFNKQLQKLVAMKYALAKVGDPITEEDIVSLVSIIKERLAEFREMTERIYNSDMDDLKGIDDYGQMELFPMNTIPKIMKQLKKEGVDLELVGR